MNADLINTNIILISTDLFLEKLLQQTFVSVSCYNTLPNNLKHNENCVIILDLGNSLNIKDLYQYITDVTLPILVITDAQNNILVQHPLIRFAMMPVHPKIIVNQINNLQEVAKNFHKSINLGYGLNLYINQNIIKDSNGNLIAKLTPKEQDLLLYLAKANKSVGTREAMLQDVWGKKYVDTKTLESHVASIRNKLGIHAKYLQINESGYFWGD